MHHEILCQVTAYGVSGGARIGVPLGTYRAPSLPLALWWLRDRAMWLARRLDPQPEEVWAPAGALVPTAREAWEVPDALRAWSEDLDEQERIGERLLGGELVEVRWYDETTEYELLAESVDALRIRRAGPLLEPADDTEPVHAYSAPVAHSRGPASYFGLRLPVDPLHRVVTRRQNA